MYTQSAPSLVILIDSLGRGGAQRALTWLVGDLVASGFTVQVIGLSGDDDAEFMQDLCRKGAGVRSIGKRALLSGTGLWRVWRCMRAARPDLIFTLLPFADQIGRVFGLLARVPVISSERSLISFRPGWALFLDRFTAPLAARLVCNSREALRQASDKGLIRPGHGVYIPNGASLTEPSASRQVLRAALELPQACRVLGTLGRFTEEKGTIYLVEAFIELAGAFPDLYLLLGGEGPLRGALMARLEDAGLADRARLPGVRPASDLLACMDVFALPSLVEGMPNALMEAMLASLPVVASRVGAVPDLLEAPAREPVGIMSPPGDVPAMASAIGQLLDNPEQATRMGSAAAAFMRASFSVAATSRAYEALFREVVDQSR